MAGEASRNIRLGLLVTIGFILLLAALYVIGVRQSMFGKTITLKVVFDDVSGLQAGNNIRFTGINVGAVKEIRIVNDTTVEVEMSVQDDVRKFIRKNSTVSIGSDGLMGNRLLNINPGSPPSPPVENGDVLAAKAGFSTDEMLETLQKTNKNAAEITDQLSGIIEGVNQGRGTIGMLLKDEAIVTELKQTVSSAKQTAENAASLTRDMQGIVRTARSGNGPIGTLLNDTTMSGSMKRTVTNLRLTTERTAALSDSLSQLVNKASNGEGAIATALNDEELAENLKTTMKNIKEVTNGLNEIMGKVQESPAVRSLHKQRDKKRKKEEQGK